MPAATHFLEIPLPEGLSPDAEELELLRATLRTVIDLRYERGHTWKEVARKLEAEGWSVSSALGWCADARRGRDHERALGPSRDEAFAELYRLTRFDDLPEGMP